MRLVFLIFVLFSLGAANAADIPNKPKEKPQQAVAPRVVPQEEHQPRQSPASDAHITGMPATFVIPKNTCESGKTLETLRSNLLKKP